MKTVLPRLTANLKLRTKLLLSLFLVIAGLTCATLLFVRQTVQAQMQQEIERDLGNAILTFRVLQLQHKLALSRKADLLATVAYIRDGDISSIQEPAQDPLRADDCDLFALADTAGNITSLYTTTPGLSAATAEAMLRQSLRQGDAQGWWFGGGHLYQVVFQPIRDGESKDGSLGTVVVGHEFRPREADDLAQISSSEVIFRSGADALISTLSPFAKLEFVQQIQGGPVSKQIRIDGEIFSASSLDLTPGIRPSVSLVILRSHHDAAILVARLNHILLMLGTVAVLAGAGLVFLISDAFTSPLRRLVAAVQALEQGSFVYPLEVQGGDEVARVTRAFNQMRTTLQTNEAQKQLLEEQFRQAHKMEAVGRLAGGVAHDFNNLLTVIKGYNDIMLEKLPQMDPLYGSGQQIGKAADRAASLTRQLLAFSRMQVLEPKILDLNVLVSDMSKLMSRLIREDISFSFHPDQSLKPVKADAGQVEQVILNLTVNACDAMTKGGQLTIETCSVKVNEAMAQTRPQIKPGEYVLLAVTDTGHGMDDATKAHIFEPFFTTKERGKGTGLGLATVYGVVKQSGGWIWVETAPGKGARFEIYLPQVEARTQSAHFQTIPGTSLRGVETLLVVEDEDSVRELAAEFLKSAGYQVITAKDGAEALQMAEHSQAIHALVTDVVMPHLQGPELAKLLKQRHPDIVVVYMSGYLDYHRDAGDFLEDEVFLQKPYTRETLVRKVHDALKGQSAERHNADACHVNTFSTISAR
jgi:signal transduction histidine kinase/CheY-like chemotaxis protein